MKHSIKKTISLVLVLAMSLAVSVPGFAAEKQSDISISAILEQAPSYYEASYQKEIQETNQKINDYLSKKNFFKVDKDLRINGEISPMSGSSKYLSVSLRKQENSYYCGPASTQMTLNYIKGILYSQSALATDMGTTSASGTYVYKIAQELNNKIGSSVYQYVQTSDRGFGSGLAYSIDKNKPVICHTSTGVLPTYTPATSCDHYIVSIGYSYDTAGSDNVRYNDPNNNSKHYGVYNTSWSNMSDAINNRAGFYIMAK